MLNLFLQMGDWRRMRLPFLEFLHPPELSTGTQPSQTLLVTECVNCARRAEAASFLYFGDGVEVHAWFLR